jgi:hypothetical protein
MGKVGQLTRWGFGRRARQWESGTITRKLKMLEYSGGECSGFGVDPDVKNNTKGWIPETSTAFVVLETILGEIGPRLQISVAAEPGSRMARTQWYRLRLLIFQVGKHFPRSISGSCWTPPSLVLFFSRISGFTSAIATSQGINYRSFSCHTNRSATMLNVLLVLGHPVLVHSMATPDTRSVTLCRHISKQVPGRFQAQDAPDILLPFPYR